MDPIDYSHLKPVDYFRKSTEAEDRQALSLESQREECKRTKDYYRLPQSVVVFEESKSAKTADKRPMYSEMMHMIRIGKVDAIVCWNLTRLARNMTEGGEIIDLLTAGKIKAIITPTEVFNQNTDVSIMALYFGASKQYVKTLSRDVKRGQRKKADLGVPHGVAPVGFLNDKTEEKGKRKWLVDTIRFPIVKKILQMFLTGKYSAPKLREVAKSELKLTTLQRKKLGGKPIAKSYMYTLLKNPIYAGFFFLEGKRYDLDKSLPRLISLQEHQKIQDLLGIKGRPRLAKREATYNHFATCGTCSGMLSPDFKFQVICSECKKKFSYLSRSDCPSCEVSIEGMKNPKYLTYVFYYCINDKKHRTKCPGNGIEEKNLEQQLAIEIETNLTISKELSAWCIDNIGKLKDEAVEDAINMQRNLESEKIVIENKLKRLTILRISKDQSKEEMEELDGVQKQLREELSMIALRLSDTNVGWFDEAKKDFDLMAEILNTVRNGTPQQKKDVLCALRSNLTISAKKLSITNGPAIETFKTYLGYAKEENRSFEPLFCEADKDKTEVFASVRPTLLPG